MFALLMKAAQLDPYFLEAGVLPQVLDMSGIPEINAGTKGDLSDLLITRDDKVLTELMDALKLMQQANNLGSIMKFRISSETRDLVERRLREYRENGELPPSVQAFLPAFRLLLVLTAQYAAVVANPPYMGSGNMNAALSKYVADNYTEGKADLFAVFMYVAMNLLQDKGKMGMINMQSWMFLSSFEKLRKFFLDNYQIDNMLHLGPRTFDELSGEVVQNTTFVISKHLPLNGGVYHRLIDGRCCADKEDLFFKGDNCYKNISQKNFEKIPGCPIGYWVSNKIIKTFSDKTFDQIILADGQNKTGNNDMYLRLLWELSCLKIGKGKKYIQYAKGGIFRKWYGNIEHCVQWDKRAQEFYRKDKIARIIKEKYWFKKGFTFSRMSSIVNCRLLDEQGTFDATTISFYLLPQYDLLYHECLGFFNSKICDSYVKLLNPTLVFQLVDIRNIPILFYQCEQIHSMVRGCIKISRQDWDSHETSWDFQQNELIRLSREDFSSTSTEQKFHEHETKVSWA